MTIAKKKLARWQSKLLEFEFVVVHWAAIKHQAANALSRLPTTGNDDTLLNDDIPILTISYDDTVENGSSVLTINNAKHGWRTKLVSADETDVSILR